jgi:hypothetical protein
MDDVPAGRLHAAAGARGGDDDSGLSREQSLGAARSPLRGRRPAKADESAREL